MNYTDEILEDLEDLDKKIKEQAKRKKSLETIFGWIFLIAIVAVCSLSLNIPQHFYWQQIPGARFEKQHYTAAVYVKVYPSLTGNKYYWLKGVIERDNTCDNNFALDIDNTDCSLAYNLEGFRWPNGGVAYFDSCPVDFQLERIKNVSVGCDTDSKDSRTYYVQLTNKLAT